MENQLEKLEDLHILLQNFCGEHGAPYENIKAELKKFCSVEEESLKEKMDELYVEMDREVLNRDKHQSNSSTKEEHQQKIETIDRKCKELDLMKSVQYRLEEMELNDNALQETLRSIQLEIIQIQSGNSIGCDMVHIESLEKKVDEIKRKRNAGEWDLGRSLDWFKNHTTVPEHSPKYRYENPSSSGVGVIEDTITTPSVLVASMTSSLLSGAAEEQGMDNICTLAASSSCRDSSKGFMHDNIDELTNDVSRLKMVNAELKEKLMAEKGTSCVCTRSSACQRSNCDCVRMEEFCGSNCKCSFHCKNRIPSGPGSPSTATKSRLFSRCKDITEKEVEELNDYVCELTRENVGLEKKLKFKKAVTCICSSGTGCKRCDCRKIGEKCGPDCKCNPKKCTNRK